ncbi:hypothetical protein DL770_005395 [Monosporascus sp. CRB-9-2]|nr:hypothetical protein DL770_005395 [Monosporascus sp. CRB-9-2]
MKAHVLPLLALAAAASAQNCNGFAELCSRRYSEVSFVAAHNAAFVGDTAFHNQFEYPEADFNRGVRYFTTQVHNRNGQLKQCHSDCLLLDAGYFSEILLSIKGKLDANPREVATLLITNHADGLDLTEYGKQFEETGMIDYVFQPDGDLGLAEWPTLGEMIDAGTRLVVFMDYGADTNNVPYILDQFHYYFETPFSPTKDNFYQCDIDRPADILVPAMDDARDTNSVASITRQTDICESNHGRVPNVVMNVTIIIFKPMLASDFNIRYPWTYYQAYGWAQGRLTTGTRIRDTVIRDNAGFYDRAELDEAWDWYRINYLMHVPFARLPLLEDVANHIDRILTQAVNVPQYIGIRKHYQVDRKAWGQLNHVCAFILRLIYLRAEYENGPQAQKDRTLGLKRETGINTRGRFSVPDKDYDIRWERVDRWAAARVLFDMLSVFQDDYARDFKQQYPHNYLKEYNRAKRNGGVNPVIAPPVNMTANQYQQILADNASTLWARVETVPKGDKKGHRVLRPKKESPAEAETQIRFIVKMRYPDHDKAAAALAPVFGLGSDLIAGQRAQGPFKHRAFRDAFSEFADTCLEGRWDIPVADWFEMLKILGAHDKDSGSTESGASKGQQSENVNGYYARFLSSVMHGIRNPAKSTHLVYWVKEAGMEDGYWVLFHALMYLQLEAMRGYRRHASFKQRISRMLGQ